MVVYILSKCYILKGNIFKLNITISSIVLNQMGNLFQLGM